MAFVIGTIPPVLFLFYTQWAMYGNPFLPGQFWMPDQNQYTELGMRGFDWPALDLFVMNLFHPGYGIYTWGPILLLSLIPVIWYRTENLVLPRWERRWVIAAYLALLVFSSANQYARLQWNSGIRYLVPIIPFLFVALSDHWIRLPRWAHIAIAAPAILHSWVLTVFREQSVQQSWQLFLHEGIQLPWFRVLTLTSSSSSPFIHGQTTPIAILALTLFVVWMIWRYGAKLEAATETKAVTMSLQASYR
jgi:hypothetical protein